MTAIFVSYRREDTQGWAGRLVEAIGASFPQAQIFMDLKAIEAGDDFAAVIERALEQCEALIALIGPRWLKVKNKQGQRRIDDPKDFVRLEITTALKRKIRVIPVLLGSARVLNAKQLPAELRALARRQGHEVSDKRWDFDVGELITIFEKTLQMPRRPIPKSDPTGISVGSGLVITSSTVGDIVGIKSNNQLRPSCENNIDIGRDARIKQSTVGDIGGVKVHSDERGKKR